MTDRVEVDKLLTHLHELEQLVSGLRDKEVPGSFFGESFELIQRISRSVYTIEQTRNSGLEQKIEEQRACIEEIGARLSAEEQKVKEVATEKESIEAELIPVSKVEEKHITSLKETLERKTVTDLRKSFSLNDYFLFKKELFGGNEEVMFRVLDSLNQESSLEKAMAYLHNEMNWDFKSDAVVAFVSHLEKRFL